MNIELTKNQYKDYLKKNASRIYSEAGYSIDDYFQDANNVDIIPFDLSKFPDITPDTAKYINKYFDTEGEDRNGNYMLRGFIGDSINLWILQKENLKLNYAPYGFYYSGFGFNDTEMLIYTWCEGDITLTIFNDRKLYQQERAATEKWFDEN